MARRYCGGNYSTRGYRTGALRAEAEASWMAHMSRATQSEGPWGPWGPWTLNQDTLELAISVKREGWNRCYEVDLERIKSSAAMLDWIMQVANKSWTTPEDIGHLVRALNDIFQLQVWLCRGANAEGAKAA